LNRSRRRLNVYDSATSMDNDVYEMYAVNNSTHRNGIHIKLKRTKDDVGETHPEGYECEKRQYGPSGPQH